MAKIFRYTKLGFYTIFLWRITFIRRYESSFFCSNLFNLFCYNDGCKLYGV